MLTYDEITSCLINYTVYILYTFCLRIIHIFIRKDEKKWVVSKPFLSTKYLFHFVIKMIESVV